MAPVQCCEGLYNPRDAEARQKAEQLLHAFAMSLEHYEQAKALLERSSSPYALHLAATGLTKLMTDASASRERRLELRQCVLNALAQRAHEMPPFAASELVQLLVRVTKVSWWDSDTHRDIVQDTTSFLNQPSSEHHLIGLRILNQLVLEMNTPTSGHSLIQQRKTSMSFRDAALLHILQIGLTALRQQHQSSSSDPKLTEYASSLVLRCLSFDFVGTSQDDSTEDLGTIQVPTSWRSQIEDENTMHLLFDVYKSTSPPISNTALEALVKLASVRRSLFQSESERSAFLGRFIAATRDVLVSQTGLQQHDNYHEFCKLLGRLKTNYQLSELVCIDSYRQWIEHVATFTLTSLESWQWAGGSIYYLLCLWSRLVTSVPYLKTEAPSHMDTYVPQIVETYVRSRLEAVESTLTSGIELEEDPLENEERLQDQLDNLPLLCRFNYDSTLKMLLARLDPLLNAFIDFSNSSNADEGRIELAEGQLTWLVYIIGSVVRGRLSSTSSEQHELADGELACRVFRLVQVMDGGAHACRQKMRSKQRLDMAILSFFQHFRKVYVGEQIMHQSKVYSQLSESLGLPDHLAVLNAIVSKVTSNLKAYTTAEDVVEKSLSLLQELAGGYMSGKLLLRIDTIGPILTNHTAENFPFLAHGSNTRNRTTFYFTIGRLLFMDDSQQKFKYFVEPFTNLINQLKQQAQDTNAFRSQEAKVALIGLFRDIRGVTQAATSRKTYGMVFDWLYPQCFPLVQRTAEAWCDDPEVITPLLKFMCEFVHNKTQRLVFDSSSVNGILLFREVSKLLTIYGNYVLSLGTNVSDVYKSKYKGIATCLRMLTRALSGNYINFGVFELYNDPALNDALDIAIKMGLSIPLSDVLAYRKVARAYFSLVDTLCHSHIRMVVLCNTQTFSHIIYSLEQGLKSLDVGISSQCASAIDNIATFYFNRLPIDENGDDAAQAIATHLSNVGSLLLDILQALFEMVLYQDCANQWSLSRPMLSIILVNESYYSEVKARVVNGHPPERQQKLSSGFDKLMHDVKPTLDPKNRDRFTQNLTTISSTKTV